MAADQRDGGGEIPLKRRLTLPELYDQHYRTMVRLASIYVDDTGTAEEVVQDSFVKLISGNYEIEGARQVAYLRQMVLNGARSTLRKRRVRRAYIPEEPGTAPAAEIDGVASAERDRVVTAIRKLPKNQANVILLRYYLDLSEGEIADTLGMARGSVKSHAHRGLKKLRVVLGEPGPIDLNDSPKNDRPADVEDRPQAADDTDVVEVLIGDPPTRQEAEPDNQRHEVLIGADSDVTDRPSETKPGDDADDTGSGSGTGEGL